MLLSQRNDTPDIFICNPGPNLTQYVEAGVVADLTDILTNQEKNGTIPLVVVSLKELHMMERLWQFLQTLQERCVFYNTEIFEEAGVVPTTYDELLARCEKIQAKRLYTDFLFRRYSMVSLHGSRLPLAIVLVDRTIGKDWRAMKWNGRSYFH